MVPVSQFIPGRGRRALAPAALAALLGAAALAGCGGSSSTTTTVVSASSGASASGPGAARQVSSSSPGGSGEAVVTVAQTPITRTTLDHWVKVTAALSHSQGGSQATSAGLQDHVLGFLITSDWMFGEAAHLGITASEAQVHQRLAQNTAKHYPTHAQLQRYLASIGETEADLRMRVKVELLQSKIAQQVTAGKSASTEVHALLSSFQRGFETRWRARTNCRPGYVMEDCRQFKGTPQPQSTASSQSIASRQSTGTAQATGGSAKGSSRRPQSSSSSSRSSSSSSSASADANSTGEVYNQPGGLTLSSTAFPLNGVIPTQYTCEGANVSPPLQWSNLPAHTVELVLFIIDDSSDGAEGGIRWVVAGLQPSLTGIAAGSLPAGAVVGLNGSGKADYGGICPPKGKTAAVEFVLWALSKQIPLSNGFIPAIAEHDYSHSELSSSTYYASYTRPS